jgi:hypothetical protein
MPEGQARLRPMSIARARVTRADGTSEVHYSAERIPLWQIRRRLRLRRHLALMRKEDRQWR